MRNQLARCSCGCWRGRDGRRRCRGGSRELQKRFARDAALAQGALENPPELSLQQPVLVTQLLFFTERNRVIGLFPARPFGPCIPGG